jgi:FkbM family methyltransferase
MQGQAPLTQVRRQLARQFGLHRRKHRFRKPEEALLALRGAHGLAMVFDVGAFVGKYAESVREYFPAATLHCFEPFPESFGKLQRNLAGTANIFAHPFALSSEKGRVKFYSHQKPGTNSLLPTDAQGPGWSPAGALEARGEVEVETTTLDEFCAGQGIDHIDLLKLDTQGAEVKVLRGAQRMLAEKRVDLIFAEVNFVPIYQGQAFFHDVCAQLHPHGFRLFDLYGLRYSPAGQIKWGDALFVREP